MMRVERSRTGTWTASALLGETYVWHFFAGEEHCYDELLLALVESYWEIWWHDGRSNDVVDNAGLSMSVDTNARVRSKAVLEGISG